MSVYGSMQELIGNTPLVKLNSFDLPEGVSLYAKLELYNPSTWNKRNLDIHK